MEIRRIFVPLLGSDADKITLSSALVIAKHLKAHAEVYFVCERTSETLPYLGIGEYLTPGLDEKLKQEMDAEAKRAFNHARETFETLCAEYEVEEVKEARGPGSSSARLQTVAGPFESILPRLARLSDLGMFSGPFEHHYLTPNLMEKTLLTSGRPLVFAPWQSVTERLKRVAVAWDGSVPAARAVFAAQPFFQRAGRIDVLHVTDQRVGSGPAKELAEYLSWHGLRCNEHVLEKKNSQTGRTLLDAATEFDANLLVMGAYAHNWYEEIVIGGTTLFVLENTEVPLLIMH